MNYIDIRKRSHDFVDSVLNLQDYVYMCPDVLFGANRNVRQKIINEDRYYLVRTNERIDIRDAKTGLQVKGALFACGPSCTGKLLQKYLELIT